MNYNNIKEELEIARKNVDMRHKEMMINLSKERKKNEYQKKKQIKIQNCIDIIRINLLKI